MLKIKFGGKWSLQGTAPFFRAFFKTSFVLRTDHYTVVSPNKGTLKICEIGSKKGILLILIPYLKNFDESGY